MSDRSRRLYFALWPDDALRAALSAATARAVRVAGGRAVPPENLHVTLAFLGSVPGHRVAAAQAAARLVTVAPGVQAFDRVAQWGRSGPLVLAATRVEPALAGMQATLANALLAADFPLDRREFRPHVTLARRPTARWPAAPPEAPGGRLEWSWSTFVLVDSETGPGGSRYTVVERFGAG
jgi:RNA 2',3'-cyclic 3'-phosphodiesterase